ncbi:MAG: Ribosome bioproteinsis protein brx1 [Cyphobasidiales sp. Tagirdzhanova-0007]|nr:MAG: Ribosome bioproteinsis protein brx1 [Cyphobasidiales sp. Tagirdzhanova-0007]
MAPSTVFAKAQAASAKARDKRKRSRRDEGDNAEEMVVPAALSDEEDEESEEEGKKDDDDEEDSAEMSTVLAREDDEVSKKSVFKQKTLILSSRGITHRMRHLMKDLAMLLPHSKSDAKLDTKHQLSLLNELADLSNCSSLLFFEARRHSDLYLWASMTPNGPSVRFHLLNAHTMDELKMTGNCLKGSRPVIVFDHTFDETFAVPKTARRAKPFVDHVTSFSFADGKIWFRNYQIVQDAHIDHNVSEVSSLERGSVSKSSRSKHPKHSAEELSMNEIGPRFVLVPVKIFEGSFGGAVVWENPDFVTPTAKLTNARLAKAAEYKGRKDAELDRKGRKEDLQAKEQRDSEKSGRASLSKRRVFA